MLKDLFKAKPKYVTVRPRHGPPSAKSVPEGLWTRCEPCGHIAYNKELEQNLGVCTRCGYHFRIGAWERLYQLIDHGTFREYDSDLATWNVLDFPGYDERLTRATDQTGLRDAVITGEGTISGLPVAFGVFDFGFMAASMGSVVGERVTRLFERAAANHLPAVVVCAGGGARMQEGVLSLLQMAKTCQAVERFSQARRPYISILTDPTLGGVYASFASLGDIVLAERGALVGFAGPRIVEKTTRQKLPAGFQSAEFALEHGMVDLAVERKELKPTLSRLLRLHQHSPCTPGPWVVSHEGIQR